MADGAIINAGRGRVTITSERDVTIGRIVTTNGTSNAIRITSNAGAIIDGGDSTGENLVAESAGSIVTLRAVTGIGSATGFGGDADLETSVNELVAVNAPDADCGVAASGNIQIDETNNLNLRGIDQQGPGLISAIADGTIVVTAPSAGGTGVHSRAGLILISAEGNSFDLDIRSAIDTTGGAITLKADNDIVLGQIGNGLTGQIHSHGGNIVVLADDDANADAGSGGELFLRDGSVISATRDAAAGGTIELRADENITLGLVTTTNNTASALTLVSRSLGLVDGGDLGRFDLEANSVGAVTTIQTVTGIGSERGLGADAHLEVRLYEVRIVNGGPSSAAPLFGAALAGSAASTNICIKEADGLRIQLIDQNNNGVVNVTTNGNLELLAGFAGVTSTSGDVTLTALGANANVVIESQVATTGGNVTVNADHDIRMGGVARVASFGGNIRMTAGADGAVSDNQGAFFMADGAVIDGNGGEIRLTADQTVTLGHVISRHDCNTLVAITSQRSSIVDGGSSGVTDVTAGTLVLRAATGIGTGNALDIAACKLSIINSGSGNVEINSIAGEPLEIGSADGVNGVSNVGSSPGTIDIKNVGTINVNSAIRNTTGGNLKLTAEGAAADVNVRSYVGATGGNGSLTVDAGHDINLFDTGAVVDMQVVGSGFVILNAGNLVNFNTNVAVHSGTGSITDDPPLLINLDTPQITALGEGVITGSFGRPGEHNFTIEVDWGDGTVDTFHFADPGSFEFHHFYQGNPNAADPSAPIKINVVIKQDPHISVNELSASAIVNRDSTEDSSTADTPGEGLASFVFDVTPPVVLLTLPEAPKFIDTLQQSGVQLADGSSIRIEASGQESGVASERMVSLEILSPDGSVRQRVALSESVLDDMLDVIGKLPDGKYRFQLQEPGEERQRTLLEFEVRQGKIAGANDTGDRPPTSTKRQVVDETPADAENVINQSDGAGAAQLVMPPAEKLDAGDGNPMRGAKTQVSHVEGSSRSLWNGWSSVAAHRAWTRGGRVAEDLSRSVEWDDGESIEVDESCVASGSHGATVTSVAGGSIMLVGVATALIGATAATTDVRHAVQQVSARLSRAARLFRKYSESAK